MRKTKDDDIFIRVRITKRQMQMLHLLCEGRELKEIAKLLNISKGTATRYSFSLLEKAGVNEGNEKSGSSACSRVKLFRWAVEEGLVVIQRRHK